MLNLPSMILMFVGCDGCGSKQSSDDSDPAQVNDACLLNLDKVGAMFPEAGTLGECTGDGALIANSLMNLDGITIDNGGELMQPCVQILCDDDFAYITTNDLPFFDYIDLTGRGLVENQLIYRIPLVSEPFEPDITSDNIEDLDTCVDAYNAYLIDPNTPFAREPSSYCVASSTDTDYLIDPATGLTVHKIFCLSQSGALISGNPTYAPNEADRPPTYDSTAYWYPTDDGSDDYAAGTTLALDLCGFHSRELGHNHVANEACYELDADNRPLNTYDDIIEGWDLLDALDGACLTESPIVGWSLDGHPIKGPCACVARDDEDNCTSIKRARSSWHYAGFNRWSTHEEATPDANGLLALEGEPCTSDGECCPEGTLDCAYVCQYETFIDESSADGSVVDQRCVLHDYTWCAHEFVDHSAAYEGSDFVYMDVCNGYDGPDGYVYYATMSFPYFPSCYTDKPSRSIEGVQAIRIE